MRKSTSKKAKSFVGFGRNVTIMMFPLEVSGYNYAKVSVCIVFVDLVTINEVRGRKF